MTDELGAEFDPETHECDRGPIGTLHRMVAPTIGHRSYCKWCYKTYADIERELKWNPKI